MTQKDPNHRDEISVDWKSKKIVFFGKPANLLTIAIILILSCVGAYLALQFFP